MYCFLFLSLEKFCRYHQPIATQNVIYEELQVSIITTSKGADEKGNTSFSRYSCTNKFSSKKYIVGVYFLLSQSYNNMHFYSIGFICDR